MTGTFILNRQGEQVEVTDLKAAIQQAKDAIKFLKAKERAKRTNSDEITCPEALEDWKHDLLELEKIALKNPKFIE